MSAPAVCLIVPVKSLDDAKSRLAAALAPVLRARLVLAMLEDVLAAARAAHDGALLVATPDTRYKEIAVRFGASLLRDDGSGYNAAVSRALVSPAVREAAAAVVLPADQARAHPAELRSALAALRGAEVVVVPSRDGGTGLLGLRPPGAIVPAFGPQSATRHRALAEGAGLALAWLELPSLRHDVDTIEDLLHGELPLAPATARFVAEHAAVLQPATSTGSG